MKPRSGMNCSPASFPKIGHTSECFLLRFRQKLKLGGVRFETRLSRQPRKYYAAAIIRRIEARHQIGSDRAVGDVYVFLKMKDEQSRFLTLLGHPPARLSVEQTAWLLNCQTHDVPVLVSARLLKPLGTPMPNSVKYFATVEILELARDRSWLSKATTALSHHWKQKNLRKKGSAPHESTRTPALPVEFAPRRTA